jgi:integrase
LDLVQAVGHGLADPKLLDDPVRPLALADGRRLYEAHVSRARVVGGVRAATAKRYRAVLDKFLPFAESNGVRSWNQVDADLLKAYAAHLEAAEYADATLRVELNTLKQLVKWLIGAGHLPGSKPINLEVEKPDGTTTYCWRPEEVHAMLEHCRGRPGLRWLEAVIVGLACTGLRISEIAALRWSDVDWEANAITLTDESRLTRRRPTRRRATKSGRSRSFPINPALAAVLKRMERASDGLVYHGPHGGRLKADTVRVIFVRDVLTPLKDRFPIAADAAGFADGRLHSFRHYFCSMCATDGTPERVVMHWLGHTDSKMVKHYFHLFDEEAQRHMSRLDFIGSRSSGVAGPGGTSDG